ncbi:RcnB family protein [Brucella sp. HL-2]|nr:RcnB family protein [Brucella sp. HL-2]MCV9910152.1 RcnB family protein [Brucella sp. HL-2]
MMKPIVLALTVFSFLAAPVAMAQHQPSSQSKSQKVQQHKSGPKQEVRKQQSWKKGNRLPANYRGNQVKNYSQYKLSKPPRGYHWVKVNNDYLLISVASGIISNIVSGR